MLLTKMHLMFVCELEKGTGNIAELFRFRLRSSRSGVRDTWEGEQKGDECSTGHSAQEELDPRLNLADS